MVIVQNSNKDIVAVGTTLPKAMFKAGIPEIKYEYIRSKMSEAGPHIAVSWKEFYFSRW